MLSSLFIFPTNLTGYEFCRLLSIVYFNFFPCILSPSSFFHAPYFSFLAMHPFSSFLLLFPFSCLFLIYCSTFLSCRAFFFLSRIRLSYSRISGRPLRFLTVSFLFVLTYLFLLLPCTLLSILSSSL